MPGGEFDWGGRLEEVSGAQGPSEWSGKPFRECKGRRDLTVTPTGGAGTKVRT